MKKNPAKFIPLIILFALAIVFTAAFSGPKILTAYIETGIGSCSKIPILCKMPTQEIINPQIDKDYTSTLIPYKFSKLSIAAPKGFAVIQELEKKLYYKKRLNRHKESVLYAFHQEPGYFTKLFPQVKKIGINNNYDFIKQLAFARIDGIKNIADAFFVVLKSIFTPDIGDQNKVVMASFVMPGRRGFISYNLFDKEYYFDCDIVMDSGDFFKVYVRDKGDKGTRLELKEVYAIISTLNK